MSFLSVVRLCVTLNNKKLLKSAGAVLHTSVGILEAPDVKFHSGPSGINGFVTFGRRGVEI
jgi:hypothetical protein